MWEIIKRNNLLKSQEDELPGAIIGQTVKTRFEENTYIVTLLLFLLLLFCHVNMDAL